MASKTFTDGELNYFRICYIVTRVVPEELRKFFKQEWNNIFKDTLGEWDDTAKNGTDFYNMESPENQIQNEKLLNVMAKGNTSEWDCTCLFYALLYSDSLGKCVKGITRKSIYAIKNVRNDVFAHTIDGSLEEMDFQATVQKILTAFSTLKLDPSAVKDMKNQKSFKTDELISVLQELETEKKRNAELFSAVEDMKNEKSFLTEELSCVQQELETEKKRNVELFSFCVLPPKPSHDTTERSEVSSIYEEMTKLRNAKKKETTGTYLSGNPGCGKTEMARQIGQKHFKEEADEGADLRFVFTLNGFSLETLLQSYVEFAGRLNCDQDCITSINTAKDLKREEKIKQIRGYIATRIQTYSSWLLIVDNIVDLKSVFQYFPQAGEKTIGKGQILVTTQDSQSIPKSDSYTYHTSLSPGMKQEDSIALLCQVSGLESKDDDTLEVAKALDFQPLALACAAVYMKQICSTGKAITWGKYLQKLQNDQREATEAAYEETSLAYRKTMTTSVKLALERVVDKNEVMMHAFQFLSSVAPDPIPLKYVVQYVKNYMPDQDEDLLAAKISSSSLVISSDDEAEEVRLHQVVYQCLQNVLTKRNVSKCDVFDVVLAFSDIDSFDIDKIADIVGTRKLVPHFKSISATLQFFIKQEARPFVRNSSLCSKFALVTKRVAKIGKICFIHGWYQASRTFFQITFMIQQETENDENDPSLAPTLSWLGICNLALGQLENAQKNVERAMSIEMRVWSTLNSISDSNDPALKANHRNLLFALSSFAKSLSIQGCILTEMGQDNEAKTHLERALTIHKKMYGEEHPKVASSLNNLAICLRNLRKYKEAKECAEKSLAIRENAQGPTHLSFAESLSTLRSIFADMGQHNEAKTHLERALTIFKKVYGEEHPKVATILDNLARCFCHLQKYKEAKECAEKSLAIRENTQEHSSVAKSLSNLGYILGNMGQHNEARAYFERALAIVEPTNLGNRQILAGILNELGNSLYSLGHFGESRAYYERALSILVQLYDEGHPTLLTIRGKLQRVREKEEELSRRKRMSLKRRNSSSESACSQTRSPPSMGASIPRDTESLHQHILRSGARYSDRSTNGGPPSERITSSKKMRRM